MHQGCLLKLANYFSKLAGTCLFLTPGNNGCSYLTAFPWQILQVQGGRQTLTDCNGIRVLTESDPWEGLKNLMQQGNSKSSLPEWVGYFSYEMGGCNEIQCPHFGQPEAWLQRSAVIFAIDHRTGKITFHAEKKILEEKGYAEWAEFSRWEKLVENLSDDPPSVASVTLKATETKESYLKKIHHIQEAIYAGDVYQVNLSHLFEGQGQIDPFALFWRLYLENPASYSAFLNIKGKALVSSSPELFLSKRGTTLETRPIKGTAPRGKTSAEDQKHLQSLKNSPKERAELLMITDLMRNDLGKISIPGSVETPHLFATESYANVFHMHSVIHSNVLPKHHALDIIRACFPGGSITGCPKLNAMEWIANLEQRTRGIYTGSIGLLFGNGDFDWNIAIRTAEIVGEKISIQFGGGIVVDSIPEEEYAETLHKGATFFKILSGK